MAVAASRAHFLPAIPLTQDLRKRTADPRVEPPPVSVECADCGRQFPYSMTERAADGRVCKVCRIDGEARPIVRTEVLGSAVGGTTLLVGLVAGAAAQVAWFAVRAASGAPITQSGTALAAALLVASGVTAARGWFYARERAQWVRLGPEAVVPRVAGPAYGVLAVAHGLGAVGAAGVGASILLLS